jgi:hypothetical protein
MLQFLRGKFSDRKLRLFACAVCRRAYQRLPGWVKQFDERTLRALEVAEQYVDGMATDQALSEATAAAEAAYQDAKIRPDAMGNPPTTDSGEESLSDQEALRIVTGIVGPAELIGRLVARENAEHAAWYTMHAARLSAEGLAPLAEDCDVIRCITRWPATPALHFNSEWRAWNRGTVHRLAQAAHELRRLPEGVLESVRLVLLADALEDAGCTDADLLGHLRSPGPHVRGCWAVDLVLGKE